MKQNIGLTINVGVGCLTCFRREPLLPADFDVKSDGFTLAFKLPKGWILKQDGENEVVVCGACAGFVKDVPDAPEAPKSKSKKVAA